MKTLLLIIALAISAAAQVHVGVIAGVSKNFGLSRPTFGVTGGIDRGNVSADVDYFNLCKKVGGCGYQVNVRGGYAVHVTKFFAIQGGVIAAHYKVPAFSKTSLQLLGGVKFIANRVTSEVNYRHDLTSNNRQRIIEARVTVFAPHHIFIRGAVVGSLFYVGKTSITGTGFELTTGVYF